jgi:hypothetical protein
MRGCYLRIVTERSLAFLDIRQEFEMEKKTVLMFNIVSIGDSLYEEEAAHSVRFAL